MLCYSGPNGLRDVIKTKFQPLQQTLFLIVAVHNLGELFRINGELFKMHMPGLQPWFFCYSESELES